MFWKETQKASIIVVKVNTCTRVRDLFAKERCCLQNEMLYNEDVSWRGLGTLGLTEKWGMLDKECPRKFVERARKGKQKAFSAPDTSNIDLHCEKHTL